MHLLRFNSPVNLPLNLYFTSIARVRLCLYCTVFTSGRIRCRKLWNWTIALEHLDSTNWGLCVCSNATLPTPTLAAQPPGPGLELSNYLGDQSNFVSWCFCLYNKQNSSFLNFRTAAAPSSSVALLTDRLCCCSLVQVEDLSHPSMRASFAPTWGYGSILQLVVSPFPALFFNNKT